jgi:hypothetical protein
LAVAKVHSFAMQWVLPVVCMACVNGHELYCPGASQFHIENGDVEFKHGGFSMTGDARVSSKTSWNLLGGYVEFDMDTTQTQPGIISTFYTTSPEEANCGMACYCDINSAVRPCLEMDLVENNGNCVLATTTHTHATDGVSGNRNCDKWGCASKTPLPGTPVHMKGVFAEDGTLSVYLDGVANNKYSPVPSDASNAVVAATMKRIGAVIVSSQWYSSGWVPGKDDCPAGTKENLASSFFLISNLRVNGTVKNGPEPPKCASLPSSASTAVISTTLPASSNIATTSMVSRPTSRTTFPESPPASSTSVGADELRSASSTSVKNTTTFRTNRVMSSSSSYATSTTSTWMNASSTEGDQQGPTKTINDLLSVAPRLSCGLFVQALLFLFAYF